jgi:membrane protein
MTSENLPPQSKRDKQADIAYQKLAEQWKRFESTGTMRAVGRSALIQRGIGPWRAFFTKFFNDWTMNLQAGALAYHLLLALFPVMIFVFLLLKVVLGNADVHVQLTFVSMFETMFPQDLGLDLMNQLLQRSNRISTVLFPLAVVLCLLGGSRLFVSMENCFDLIYHLPPRPPIRQNLVALGMLLLFTILIPLSMFGASLPTILFSLVKDPMFDSSPTRRLLLSIVSIAGGIFVMWLFFEAIYMIVPNRRISLSHSWRGAVVATAGIQAYFLFFPFYLTHFLGDYGGQVGFAIILIVFFYYFAVILLLGAQVNAFFCEGVQKTPQDLATLIYRQTNLAPKPPEEQHVQAAPEHKRDMDNFDE